MTNPTTPFSWQMPTSTDLVTDLPADFETFGQAVATSMADLLGGTTGQVLSKASNTDMDFTWVAQDDSNAIQNAIVDAKGDLIAATANDIPARLAVGANGTILTADSSTATGLKWATPSAPTNPTFYAFLSSNQTVTSNVATKVQCNSEEFDLGSCYDNATNYRFTPTTAGIYQVNLMIQGNGSSGTTIWLYKNGSNIREAARTAGAGSPISAATFVSMNGTTDYLEFYATVASGTIIYGGAPTTGFGAAWIRSN